MQKFFTRFSLFPFAVLMYNKAMNQHSTPLWDIVEEYANKHAGRFHTPGHAGKEISPLYRSAPYDITELSFSDNLLCGENVILNAEELYADLYSKKKAYFCTSGATTALFCAIYACTLKSNKTTVLLSQGCHKSIFHALNVFRLNYKIVTCSQAAFNLSDVLCAIYTSPDYFGACNEPFWLDQVRKSEIPVICDHAHGSHFIYHDMFPKTPDCDILIISPHKTLPVYTGGAVICSDILNDELLYARETLHTTSPSYLTLCSLDYARRFCLENPLIFEETARFLKQLSSALSKVSFFQCHFYDDPFRLSITSATHDIEAVANHLEKHNLYPEAVIGNTMILIVNAFNDSFLNQLPSLLKNAPCKLLQTPSDSLPYPILTNNTIKPNTPTTLSLLPVEECEGKLSAREVGLYPPGVPFLVKGSVITKEHIRFISRFKNKVFGLAGNRMCVLQ